MTLDDAVRRVIDEAVQPQLADHRVYVANARPDAIPIARADLLYLWDEYRAEYLDWASLGNPVGHAHPIVTHQVNEHHRYYGHTAPPGRHVHRWVVQYAKDLSAQFTGEGQVPRQVLFCEGEREAVRQALQLTVGTGSAAVGGDYGWLSPLISYPATFDPADAAWDRIGALLLNMALPGGDVMTPGVARRWMLAARAQGIPVIVDETVTGFGRLGRMWGQQGTGLSADLTVLGGPVGGGYPLGAVIAAPGAFQGHAIDVSDQAANPIACCAGAATLTTVGMGTLEHMAATGPVLDDGLAQLREQFPRQLRAVHGHGHLRGLRFADADRAEQFVTDARAQGLYLAPPVGDSVVLAPVLITSDNELSRGLDIIAAVLMSWDEQEAP